MTKRVGGDRGGTARGGPGGGKRPRPEPQDDDSDDDAGDEDEEPPQKPVKRSTARQPAAPAKGDSAKRRRQSARDVRPPQAEASAFKKAMFIGTPIMALVFVGVLIFSLSNKPDNTPKKVVIDHTKDIDKAKKLREDAFRLLQDAQKAETPESKRPLLLKAREMLKEAQGLIDKVREVSPDPGPDKEYPFEQEAQRINEGMKVARTAIMEIGE